MNKYVYGDRKRIFLNTVLGCNCKCKYCYLNSSGISSKTIEISAEETIEKLERLDFFEKGCDGTILSIGCYSEC